MLLVAYMGQKTKNTLYYFFLNAAYGQPSLLLYVYDIRPKMVGGAKNARHGFKNVRHCAKIVPHGVKNVQHGAKNVRHGAKNVRHDAKKV